MKRKGCLLVLFSLCMGSPAVMADDYSSALELNRTQMDSITAGVFTNANAISFGAGVFSITNAATLTFAGASNGGEFGGAGAGAAGVGSANAAQVTVATGTFSSPSFTRGVSVDFQSPLSSISGALEFTFAP